MRRRPPALAVCAALAAASAFVAACTEEPPAGSSEAAAAPAVSLAPSTPLRHLDPAAFAAAVRVPGTVVVDVRSPAEFAAGHLPGAVDIDFAAGQMGVRLPLLDRTATYALYCQSGNRSAAAGAVMEAAGFASVYDLQGGLTAWVAAGQGTVTGP